MSSLAVTSYSNTSDQFASELTADWFDQFLNYNPIDSLSPGKSNLPETICLDSPEGEHHYDSAPSGSKEGNAQQPNMNCSWGSEFMTNEDSASFCAFTPKANELYQISNRAAVSDIDLLSFAKLSIDLTDHQQDTDFSPPPSPSPNPATFSRRKNRFVDSISRTLRRATSSLENRMRSPVRKSNTLPQLMRASNKSQYDVDSHSQQPALDASLFDFGFSEQTAPLTPPMLTRFPHASQRLDSMSGFNCYSAEQLPLPAHYSTPMGTPALEHDPFRDAGSFRTPSNRSLYPQTPEVRHASTSFSQFPESQALEDFRTLGMYGDGDPTSWWNNTAAVPLAHASPIPFQLNTQRAPKTHQLQNDFAFDINGLDYNMDDMGYNMSSKPSGLMVQMPDMSSQHSNVMDSSPFNTGDYYPPLPPEPQLQSQYSPSHTGRGRQPQRYAVAPRDRHASLSTPKNRSRSSGSELSSSQDATSSFNVRKQRKSSRSKSRSRKPSAAPRTVTFGSVGDFVNYTPKDGRSILNGVAPSGSSKTKARREQEALEKRRRLEQAAVRVVMAAGGDVGSLMEEGLLG